MVIATVLNQDLNTLESWNLLTLEYQREKKINKVTVLLPVKQIYTYIRATLSMAFDYVQLAKSYFTQTLTIEEHSFTIDNNVIEFAPRPIPHLKSISVLLMKMYDWLTKNFGLINIFQNSVFNMYILSMQSAWLFCWPCEHIDTCSWIIIFDTRESHMDLTNTFLQECRVYLLITTHTTKSSDCALDFLSPAFHQVL